MTPIVSLGIEIAQVTADISGLSDTEFDLPTPAPGWTIRHQVAHLTSVYGLARQTATDSYGFALLLEQLSDDFSANVELAMAPLLDLPAEKLRKAWAGNADAAIRALSSLPLDRELLWLVNPIPVAVLAMAGTAEAFAHGQDIRDALGIERGRGDHIRSVCEFAYHTRSFGYLARGQDDPGIDLFFELTSPSGAKWQIGNPEAKSGVRGSAWDLALLVTRRRHLDDLDLAATDPIAEQWLTVAQAYRGPAGEGRIPAAVADAA